MVLRGVGDIVDKDERAGICTVLCRHKDSVLLL